jgi:hypothetical protein
LSRDFFAFYTYLNQFKLQLFSVFAVESYINEINIDELEDISRNEVSLVFRVALAKNPRRIVQLANKLTANYLLAVERGKENRDLFNRVIKNLGFLAKITVIEENWPNFYKLISNRPNILRQLRRYFLAEHEDFSKEVTELFNDEVQLEWNNGLENFLRRTKSINTDYITYFVKFKQKSSVLQIADYYAFYDAALSNNSDTVVDIMKYEETDIRVAFIELLELLDAKFSDQDVPSVNSLVNCIVQAFALIPEKDKSFRQNISDQIALGLSAERYSEVPIDVGLASFFDVLRLTVKTRFKNQIIRNILDQIDFEGNRVVSFKIIEVLPKNTTLIAPENQYFLRDKLDEVNLNDEEILEHIRIFAEKCRTKDQNFTKTVLPQSFFRKNINMMKSVDVGEKTLDFIKPFVEYFDSKIKNDTIGIITDHLAHNRVL